MSDLFPHYIEFRHVYKTFDYPVLVDVNFHVDAGETVAIIGRSGVGKSVSLAHIMGFLKPDDGRVIATCIAGCVTGIRVPSGTVTKIFFSRPALKT